ncbi:hypothetical protein TUM4438_39670 [Shewanella sairae]|uniref:Type-F conjugative transfer system pilin assembly thiol-disulfide isomerase TrbB n=1 Tax=Shewanella sairae TaxID=190310 RepID=A0ABQ4PQC9_9GAMM|nr:conjugal transfer protein TraF [Shewanella sairae]MCL1132087.1 conjugal transfer protein TraF [Shewanella sairae]GIU51136.1 hypothetical protein TUM4438_39670 [Shewanella sairae]
MKTILLPLILGLLLMGHAHATTAKQQFNAIVETKALQQHETARSADYPKQAEYALAYLFSPTCQYCKAFSPTLQQFSQSTGLMVYPFSTTGQGLAQYTKPIVATPDILQDFFPNQQDIIYPALFLVNVNNRKHVPLSLGNVPLDVLYTTYQGAMTYPHLQAILNGEQP